MNLEDSLNQGIGFGLAIANIVGVLGLYGVLIMDSMKSFSSNPS